MSVINVKRFGFAVGASVALLYLGCVFIMATVPKEAAIRFFNSLLHGIDVTTIIRWEMPWQEMAVGALETFVIGWLLGALVAVLYNFGSGRGDGNG
jgi:hypothetical protein